MEHIANLDDIGPRTFESGDIAGERRRLGPALGTARVGVSHYRVAPGRRMMPVHVHADEEEIFYVLSGGGLLWQKGATCEVRAGDCLVHPCNGAPHTLVAGEEGLEVLVFASGSDTSITFLPRAQAWFLGPRWLPADGPHPFQLEAQAGPLDLPEPGERPANVVNVADVEARPRDRGDVAHEDVDLGRAAGSRRSGLGVMRVPAGRLHNPPHCHSVEEEVFMVLDGAATLELTDRDGATVAQTALRPGHLVARPPGTTIAHAFRGGPGGLTLLVYGTRDDADACFYPRSQKVSLRGLGVVFRPERLDYWDGEV